jgi:CO/xanthine dehydrogenase Mo-binding subunit
MMSGGAVQAASREVRDRLLERVRERLGPGSAEELELLDGHVLVDGLPIADVADHLDVPIAATVTFRHAPTDRFDERGQGDIHVSLAYAAERAVVEVDEELGLVRVLQIAAAQDVGRAINPRGVQGQIEGATAQGVGFALMEELQVVDGAIANASFTDYLIPTIMDMPPVVSEVIEDPEPGVPFGAKGVGEHALIVAPAAIAAALRDATGRDLNRIPVRPDDLLGLAEPRPWREPPPNPDVPFQVPVPLASEG